MIDIKNIHYLFAIEELGSISAAAKRLYLSQPTLSQFLKKYEEDLGYPIFLRTKQGLKLTCEGQLFLDTARTIQSLERDMKNKLSDMSGSMTGSIVFALSAQRAPSLLPLILPDFCRQYPGVSVKIVEGRTKDLEQELKKGTIDLGILIPPLSSTDFSCQIFMEEEILLAIPRDYSFHAPVHYRTGRIPWIDPSQLADAPFLLCDINNRLHDFAEELFQRCQFRPNHTMTFKNLTLIARLASAGMGITFLPEGFTSPEYHLDYYSIGEEGCFRPLALGYPPVHYRSAAVQKFSEMLIETLRRQQQTFRDSYCPPAPPEV